MVNNKNNNNNSSNSLVFGRWPQTKKQNGPSLIVKGFFVPPVSCHSTSILKGPTRLLLNNLIGFKPTTFWFRGLFSTTVLQLLPYPWHKLKPNRRKTLCLTFCSFSTDSEWIPLTRSWGTTFAPTTSSHQRTSNFSSTRRSSGLRDRLPRYLRSTPRPGLLCKDFMVLSMSLSWLNVMAWIRLAVGLVWRYAPSWGGCCTV